MAAIQVFGEDERNVQKKYWIEHSIDLTLEAMMLDSKASDLDKEERPERKLYIYLQFLRIKPSMKSLRNFQGRNSWWWKLFCNCLNKLRRSLETVELLCPESLIESVRVSNELGAKNPKSAAFSVVVVTLLSFIISVIAAIILLALRHVISYAFTDGESVATAVIELTPFLAITLILNGIQPVLSGVAVGCGWQAFVAYVNVGCFYVVGLPLGILLGFQFDFSVKGLWSGMIGGMATQILILSWVLYRTDWSKELKIGWTELCFNI